MNIYNNGNVTLTAGDIEKIIAERDALAAQVEALKDAANFAYCNWRSSSDVIGGMRRLVDAVDSTPQQCLAEIRAEAVEVEANYILTAHKDSEERWHSERVKAFADIGKKMLERAEKIRQGGME